VTVSTSKDPARIAGMFDAIAARYDTLNHVLSVGLDRRWRRRAIEELRLRGGERVVDVCTGTGDLAVAAVTAPAGRAGRVVGIDFSREMLRRALGKVRGAGLGDRIALVRGDATRLPIADRACDAVTIAFGIRNVQDPAAACRECHRILVPGGSLAILEFGFPRIPGLKTLYTWYFRYLLPRVGRAVSKHGEAYSYLPASVEQFPTADAFGRILESVGFTNVRHVSLTFGIVYLYMGARRG
jgi:demethylmenaquinone methyltransferase/2-methoxy-6-polyprenyl-1,4-benzoquinol methylase